MKTPQELLHQALEVGECLLPDAPPGGRSAHPTVFVHGLLGWGARDALYRAVPYWGLAAGDVLGYLNRCGYDCRAASVGIISSAWDRACELYAALTGGRADYGIAHAQHFGHARFGTAYPAPLVPGWGADKPVDLVGHSFGGATARLLMQLLAHGCPEEVQAAEAAGETPSPLFTGGKTGWVHALVAIAAPHDGSTFLDVQPDAANALSTLFLGAARALGISLDDCAAALDTAKPVKGRAEPLETDGDYTILIDYAVTPDAIDNILTTVREFAPARLVFLFGCGGDRDRGKRPKMGRIAGQKADFVIVTSDNPRTEDPEAIIADILPGLKETHTPYVVRPDRREAIAYAIENHCPGDVIILCGKGHEDYQIIGKTKVHMDEREIVAEILDKRKREKEK